MIHSRDHLKTNLEEHGLPVRRDGRHNATQQLSTTIQFPVKSHFKPFGL